MDELRWGYVITIIYILYMRNHISIVRLVNLIYIIYVSYRMILNEVFGLQINSILNKYIIHLHLKYCL